MTVSTTSRGRDGTNLTRENTYLPQLSVLHEMVDPQPYEHWIELGLAMVERCDGLLRLTGDSPGAERERAHAEQIGLPWIVLNQLVVGDTFHQEWLDAARARATQR